VAAPVAEEPVVPAVEKPAKQDDVAPVKEEPAKLAEVAPKKEPVKLTEVVPPKEPVKRPAWKIWMWIGISLVALVLLALIVFVILAHVAPDFIDSLLYTPEELEILHYSGEF
ncbi:MAG: hypothetical protein J6S66_05930, partial [Bacteroidales bacterium]|nr:hypothetical protein [Bacteroidales bacterium]